ncbi:E3 ubiquitin-protein ligase PUB23-like [Primulina tabacum]|uniref:E3 ubiquitin-protein ligase PUB23-like n=1 Tax=Primulina tabacum TaxID=48773 RepID=UPI003F592ABC
MAEMEIPPYFLCPITLDIMKDPVTVSTGITYDRDSIENWIFSLKKSTCPVTKQLLFDKELTPNITLRRLIQAWCVLHASQGVERLPTPKAPTSKSQIIKLLNDANSPEMQINCLQRLKSISSQNQTNKRCMETVGTAEFLAFLIVQKTLDLESESTQACEVALSILYSLQLSESGMKSISNQEFIESLTRIMQRGSYESRAYAVMLLEPILESADHPAQIVANINPQFFLQCTQILKDEISQKATKATLKVLINVCQYCGRNIIQVVEAGVVNLLIDLLLDYSDKRACEMMLVLLDFMCQCAEGRAELLNHGAGLAVVSKKILRVSQVASEKAVKILYSISRSSATPVVLQEMLEIGVVAKLCLVLHADCGFKIKERIREMLKLHSRAWRNSSCIRNNSICSYSS